MIADNMSQASLRFVTYVINMDGAADRMAGSIEDAVAEADIVVCCASVGSMVEMARTALDAAGPDCVVTDVGSTKQELVSALGSDQRFVGGHPLAGAETAGVANARSDLYEGARARLEI